MACSSAFSNTRRLANNDDFIQNETENQINSTDASSSINQRSVRKNLPSPPIGISLDSSRSVRMRKSV